jgi:hypothetical protein
MYLTTKMCNDHTTFKLWLRYWRWQHIAKVRLASSKTKWPGKTWSRGPNPIRSDNLQTCCPWKFAGGAFRNSTLGQINEGMHQTNLCHGVREIIGPNPLYSKLGWQSPHYRSSSHVKPTGTRPTNRRWCIKIHITAPSTGSHRSASSRKRNNSSVFFFAGERKIY